jgi:hypothetical protein
LRPIHRGKADRWRAGLEVAYYWHDADVLQVSVSASNGTFTGASFPYLSPGDLANFASILEGFPTTSSDVRELEFGAAGEEFAGGYAKLRLSCRDRAGHAVAEITMESKDQSRLDTRWIAPVESAHFYAEVEPSAIDEFVKELRQLSGREEGSAWLAFRNVSS